MKDDELHIILQKGGSARTDHQDIQYVTQFTESLRKQAVFYEK